MFCKKIFNKKKFSLQDLNIVRNGSISSFKIRKRVNFYNGSKIRVQWFRVSYVGRLPFKANETRQQQQRGRTLVKKIFFLLPQSRRFPRRSFFKFIVHSYLFYLTERIRDPPAAGTVPIQLSYVLVMAMISDALQTRN